MIKLAHISDLHIAPMPSFRPREYSIKRILSYRSWQRKRHKQFSREVLDCLIADVKRQEPDHIAITGDLVNLSLDEEFSRSRKVLEDMGTPDYVSVIPGNHDAYRRDYKKTVAKTWGSYMTGDDGKTDFPYVRQWGNVMLIGLSSAVQTAPFFATGTVCKKQLVKLADILSEANRQKLFRIVMVHHPVTEGTVQDRKALTNAGKLRQILCENGAELVLHGHAHVPVREEIQCGGGKKLYVRGTAAGSATGEGIHPAHYHVFEINKKPDVWDVTIKHRQYDPEGKNFKEQDEENLHFPAV